MVGFAPRDLDGAIHLLQQHDARQIMGQRYRAERKRLVRPLRHGRVHAVGTSYDERDVASARKAQLVETARELLARALLAVDRHEDHMGGRGEWRT